MNKRYTITVEDYRGYFSTSGQDFIVKSMVNTMEFKIGEAISQKDLNRIIGDEDAIVKIVARS